MPQRAVLAVDIGGTKFAAGVVDTTGKLCTSDRVATPRAGPGAEADAEELFRALLSLCEDVQRAVTDLQIVAVGVGCGGPMRYPSGHISPLNIPGWRDFPLRDRLSDAFGLPCIVDNDAKAVALAERWRGAARGARNMMGMVVSTGVGGGIILDGRLLHGEHGNSGHIGHVIVWPGGPLCGCGARGCLEAVASGTGLTRRLSVAIAEGTPTRLTPGAPAVDIAAAARAQDPLALALMRSAGEALGRGIASAAALLDLDVVTVGGSIALRAWDLVGPPLAEEIERSARLDFTRDVRVVQAALGDATGLYGAAALAFEHFPDVTGTHIVLD